ncbi:TPA: hypothetical protein ACW5G6_004584, partial [Salmonella enterica]
MFSTPDLLCDCWNVIRDVSLNGLKRSLTTIIRTLWHALWQTSGYVWQLSGLMLIISLLSRLMVNQKFSINSLIDTGR